MEGYPASASAVVSPSAHHVSQSQSSLQGALSSRLSASEQEIQRHVEEYNRTITVVFWYKAETEPIRLQQMIPTFPYFHLACLSALVTDLSLTSKSFVDTYDPHRGKWEQHSIETVRVVEPQERLLYRARRSLLDGLSEADCPGLREELQSHQVSNNPRLQQTQQAGEWQPSGKTQLKRPAPIPEPTPPPPQKVHITNGFYAIHSTNPHSSPVMTNSTSVSASGSTDDSNPSSTPQLTAQTSPYVYQPPPGYYPIPMQASVPSSATPPPPAALSPPKPKPKIPPSTTSTTASPIAPTTTPTTTDTPPIPYHPHPPLKRWPNDYTVAELTAGFRAMEALIATSTPLHAHPKSRSNSGSETAITQRVAFERVFGSRYVKSTVCRHRGVWKRSAGPLREQFEAMGADERACWGEFLRRIEGRPAGKGVRGVTPVVGVPLGAAGGQGGGMMMFPAHAHTHAHTHTQVQAQAQVGAVVQGQMVIMGAGAPTVGVDDGQVQGQGSVVPSRGGGENGRVQEEPIMASLQKPEGEGRG